MNEIDPTILHILGAVWGVGFLFLAWAVYMYTGYERGHIKRALFGLYKPKTFEGFKAAMTLHGMFGFALMTITSIAMAR